MAFGIQTVHHGFLEIKFIFDGKVDKIGVHDDLVRRDESSVVFEEEGGSGLLDVSYLRCFTLFSHLFSFFLIHFSKKYIGICVEREYSLGSEGFRIFLTAANFFIGFLFPINPDQPRS